MFNNQQSTYFFFHLAQSFSLAQPAQGQPSPLFGGGGQPNAGGGLFGAKSTTSGPRKCSLLFFF